MTTASNRRVNELGDAARSSQNHTAMTASRELAPNQPRGATRSTHTKVSGL